MEWIILSIIRYVIILSTNPSGTAFIKVSAMLIWELLLPITCVILTKISFVIFIILDKKSYPCWIQYLSKRKETKAITTRSQLILSTSIDFLIKLIIKKSIKRLNAIGTITSLTVFPIDHIFIPVTLEKLVNFSTVPIKFPLSISIPKTVNLKLYRILIIPSNYFSSL